PTLIGRDAVHLSCFTSHRHFVGEAADFHGVGTPYRLRGAERITAAFEILESRHVQFKCVAPDRHEIEQKFSTLIAQLLQSRRGSFIDETYLYSRQHGA